MVTRKPITQDEAASTAAPPELRVEGMRQELWSPSESEQASENAWANESHQNRPATQQQPGPGSSTAQSIPAALRPGNPGNYSDFEQEEEVIWGTPSQKTDDPPAENSKQSLSHVPTVLRPGGGVKHETNPFKRKPAPGSVQEAVNVPPMPSASPPPPPPLPTGAFSDLSINESSRNPWQPALDDKGPSPVPLPDTSDQASGKNAWSSEQPSREPSRKPSQTGLSGSPALLSLASDEEGSAAWDEVPPHNAPPPPRPPLPSGPSDEEAFADQHAWDDVGLLDKGKAPATQTMPDLTAPGPSDGWNLVDTGPAPGQLSRQSTWENFEDDDDDDGRGVKKKAPAEPATQPAADEPELPPALPPRRSSDAAPPPPPRRVDTDRTETYAIKNITWHDAKSTKNPRTSPILVQNANGPCPLVALVNALTLTTPADVNTALVETLRTREQVSLELLLNAVFDELMSSRRTTKDSELPDVTELYDFLKGLDTGMNVNPRFIPTPETVKAFKRTSLTHLHPTERSDLIPGTFEDTKEMKLYATFAIPLIHGWIPPRDDAVYEALERRAASYEDVQNILFREEELEEKLSSPTQQGLTEEEQELYQDILTIKSFLSISATQLTAWGLEVLTKAIQPGTIAILFRNDHFSTLYRHPQTLELFTLVTDAGYAGHAEVVWETLSDVNGEQSEFFSGDFRLVGGANQHQQAEGRGGQVPGAFPGSSSGGQDWTAVQGGRGQERQSMQQEPPLSPAHEQEDRDLALALQLQEEEDERHRQEQARRQRESQLSEQFIEQQATQPTPAIRGGRGGSTVPGRGGRDASNGQRRRSSAGVTIPVTSTSNNSSTASVSTSATRGRGGRTGQVVRPLVPPPGSTRLTVRPPEDGLDDAPPSYEQAASQTAYEPPAGHPSHPSSSPDRRSASISSPSASTSRIRPVPSNNSSRLGAGPPPAMRPSASPVMNTPTGGRDKDCIVM
ncbi:uncharacterized protein E0L32_003220 [Thyridium curvatum]|uniref:MINDY deubiquitinase domain-containing protein n=1 Tax=Thyridium curvatum TaxID=1093900 RepID=A0A507B4B7_9PEZI|nr:uncharacterized protein E0L32_003220 [Thyridium curvatum]TPX17102.1 hypothetical protein E0L32_003220 [Thyridium curvatum]